ncbi:NUDIX hydrolase [Lottiidibacillus patelloidae]|uniref:NUDIX hydrolase n=1 Tax=Lottiidibacillus patelloidae TaxID=2670334 RepID=A0A263BV39_9BACI|nr:NUDIX hydrolase [Lottiidibacillus patelloidae]OZM57589.1 NUDIX hydrolase [Lottiidibacillus patelloidae]
MDVVFKTNNKVFNYRVAGILMKDDHVLLHRAATDTIWSLPGGRVEMGEEAAISLQREFREELDIETTIDRLVWVAENFFEYAEQDIHEVGFYYILTSNELPFRQDPFYGVEGERLVFKWTPIKELRNVALYPEFLRTSIAEMPIHTEHLVVNQK